MAEECDESDAVMQYMNRDNVDSRHVESMGSENVERSQLFRISRVLFAIYEPRAGTFHSSLLFFFRSDAGLGGATSEIDINRIVYMQAAERETRGASFAERVLELHSSKGEERPRVEKARRQPRGMPGTPSNHTASDTSRHRRIRFRD